MRRKKFIKDKDFSLSEFVCTTALSLLLITMLDLALLECSTDTGWIKKFFNINLPAKLPADTYQIWPDKIYHHYLLVESHVLSNAHLGKDFNSIPTVVITLGWKFSLMPMGPFLQEEIAGGN